MQLKYRGIQILVVLFLVIGCITACSSVNQKIDGNIDITKKQGRSIDIENNVKDGKENSNTEDNNKDDVNRIVSNFITILKSNDTKAFKEIISPKGLVVIRNFVSGNGARGKDIRDLYSIDKIPSNLEFPVKEEIPIIPKDLFKGSIQVNVGLINITEVGNINFNIIDNFNDKSFGPPTDKIGDICSKLASGLDKNQFIPQIYTLSNKEAVLTESASVSGLPNGAWAVFENNNTQYFLRAIINFR